MEKTSRSPRKYLRVLSFVIHYWMTVPWLFAGVVIARFGSTLFDVAMPTAAGRLIDSIAGGSRDNPQPAWAALGALVALVAIFQASRQIVTFFLNRMSARSIIAIGRDAFARVQRFSTDWHANSFSGATVRKVSRGMSAFDNFTDTCVFGLLPATIAVLGIVAVFAWRWPWLGAAVSAIVAVHVGVTVTMSIYWIRPANVAARESDSRMNGTLADTITGIQAVKSFAAEEREDAYFAAVSAEWSRRAIVSWDRGAWSGLVQSALLVILQVVMLGVGIQMWSSGAATPGDVAGLIATQTLLSGYLRDIGQHVRSVQRYVNDMDDVLDFRDMTPQVADAPQAAALEVRRGAIHFDNVDFQYKGASRPLFRGLSVDIPAGQRVGLVGHSGAGKTTFVKLIQRLYDIDGGQILIDGQDISQVTQASLRGAVGLVPQEPILFHRSLAENIAYGKPGATEEEIRAAARIARADTFIDRAGKGYATLVGERGIKLSGGERQRVAIARAVLAATPILILDEATSSLDSLSELYIREALERLTAGRTTLVVAHRLSTVRRLDRILVFDDGRIVEDGTHAELMRRAGGAYRGLLETQSLGLAIDEAAE